MYVMVFILFASIRHFRNKTGTGAEMRPASISGIVTGEPRAGQLLASFLIFPSNSPRRLCEK